MCPMRAFYSQRVTKKRISFDSQKNAPPFFCLFAERTHRSAFLFSGFVRWFSTTCEIREKRRFSVRHHFRCRFPDSPANSPFIMCPGHMDWESHNHLEKENLWKHTLKLVLISPNMMPIKNSKLFSVLRCFLWFYAETMCPKSSKNGEFRFWFMQRWYHFCLFCSLWKTRLKWWFWDCCSADWKSWGAYIQDLCIHMPVEALSLPCYWNLP